MSVGTGVCVAVATAVGVCVAVDGTVGVTVGGCSVGVGLGEDVCVAVGVTRATPCCVGVAVIQTIRFFVRWMRVSEMTCLVVSTRIWAMTLRISEFRTENNRMAMRSALKNSNRSIKRLLPSKRSFSFSSGS